MGHRPPLLLLLLAAVATAARLFDHGPRHGDQSLPFDETSAVAVDVPFVFLEQPHTDFYISPRGIVGFGNNLPEKIHSLESLNKSAVGVLYGPSVSGKLFYRTTSSDQRLLRQITDSLRKAFQDAADFQALQAMLVTWQEVQNQEKNGVNSYQLVLATDGMSSYAIMLYDRIDWTYSQGHFSQSGFSHADGRHQLNVNSGTDSVRELVRLSNNQQEGSFMFRISGASLEDPGEKSEDDYNYSDYETDYDGDAAKPAPNDCPPDPYRNRCPSRCEVVSDQRGCSLCVCAEPPPNTSAEDEGKGDEDEEEEEEEGPKDEVEVVIPAATMQPAQEEISVDKNPPRPQQPKVHVLSVPAESLDDPATVTCQQVASGVCHANAQCRDHAPGYCCVCATGYIGNGKECLKKGDPQRISGSLEGAINGQEIAKTDLHTFITGGEGNSYTAVSKVPRPLGYAMQLLNPIGAIMGWLFAEVQSPTGFNGFQLTGGLFNRTATVHIGDRNVVTINQQFSGRDMYHYLKANVFVRGTLPELAEGAEVSFPEFQEEFHRERPGLVRSYSSVEVKVKEGETVRAMRLTVDQQIHFMECPFQEWDKDNKVSLHVQRVNINYDPVDGIVRYASRNFAGAPRQLTGHPSTPEHHIQRRPHVPATQAPAREETRRENPLVPGDICADGRHVCTLPNMKCRAVEQSYRCECDPGYQAAHDSTVSMGWSCKDIDECTRGDHTCDQYAVCSNTEGGFSCRCQHGFTGDGHVCISVTGQHPDVPVAHGAVTSRHEQPQTALTETVLQEGSCTSHQQCHQWGECVFSAGAPHGKCKCRGWYVGDGVKNCAPPEEPRRAPQHNAHIPENRGQACGQHICHKDAECLPAVGGGSECVCKAGFMGTGVVCESLSGDDDASESGPVREGTVGTMCRSHEECSEHGSCAYSQAKGYYQCECTHPYKGDGISCTLDGAEEVASTPGCDLTRDCHANADCVFERTSQGGMYKCVCQSGFFGDGKSCQQGSAAALPPLVSSSREEEGCDRLHNCHSDAQCVFNHHTRRYSCECVEGFIGDGSNCVRVGGDQPNWEGHQVASSPMRCREATDCHRNAHCAESGRDYVCQCLPGYRGDGVQKCEPSDSCNPADPRACSQNAECVFGEAEAAYTCKCIHGFTGDGVVCTPHAAHSTCDRNPRLCHANAQCVYNHESAAYECRCKPGSRGDGQSRCDVVDEPRCSNCSSHARCEQSPTSGGWRCVCQAGYQGSGQLCVPFTSCLDNRSICSEHAECVPGEGGHYVCNCHYGYHGDGQKCEPDSTHRTDSLLVARGMAIFQRNTDPSQMGKQLIVIPHHIAVGLDFDCQNERIVWSDISGHSIRTASLNGTDYKSHFAAELESPEGIAVDWSSQNVYYADSLKDEIGVVSLDGKWQKALLTEGLVNPRALALDLNNKHLYYTDWHRENPVIGRMDLDGKNSAHFIKDDMHLPNGLTVLPNRKELCWVDAGAQRLSCIGLDGSHRRTVFAPLQYPFGLTHHNEERFYWTDWKDNRIHTVSIYGEGYSSFPISLGGSGKVYGVLNLPSKCPGGPSVCAVNNGGCSHLCLPGQDGVSCVCPDNADNC